jgi:hypothetical protein
VAGNDFGSGSLRSLAANLQRMADDYDAAADAVPGELDEKMRQLAEELQERTEYHAPRGEKAPDEQDESHLEDEIKINHLDEGTYEVFADKPYAAIVHEGRGPVEAKNAEALHFWVDGQEVFAKRVGPADPDPFLTRAVEDVDDDIADLLRDVVVTIRRDHLSNTYRSR